MEVFGDVSYVLLAVYEGSVILDIEFYFDTEGEANVFYQTYAETSVVIDGQNATIVSATPRIAVCVDYEGDVSVGTCDTCDETECLTGTCADGYHSFEFGPMPTCSFTSCSGSFLDDEPTYHFTADCSGVTMHDATCTLTVSAGFAGGSVTCNTATGQYTGVAATDTPCSGNFCNNEEIYHFIANCSGVTEHNNKCMVSVVSGFEGGSVTCNTATGAYSVVAATEIVNIKDPSEDQTWLWILLTFVFIGLLILTHHFGVCSNTSTTKGTAAQDRPVEMELQNIGPPGLIETKTTAAPNQTELTRIPSRKLNSAADFDALQSVLDQAHLHASKNRSPRARTYPEEV
jgi:hypothetical protein